MKKWVYTILIILLIPLLIITGCSQQTEKKEKSKTEKPVVSEKRDSVSTSPSGIDKSVNMSESKKQLEQNKLEFYSPFSGQPVNELILQRAVMASIENTPQSRPQSGLNEAPIVYEFLVEGGITRFLALYWYEIPDEIGPIRSLRPYMINVALEYDPLLLHAGASPGGFELLNKIQIKNLDQIFKGNYYWRSSKREIPHNLYTADFKIDDYLNNLTGWEYKPRFSFQQVSFFGEKNKDRAEEIVINYWGNYKVCYKYNPDSNNYKRFLNGFETPHLNVRGKQLIADNIIVQFTDTEVKDDVGRLEIKLQGEGKALIFKNGVVKKGKWQNDRTGYTKFYNDKGKRVDLNPGQTWIQVVPQSATINYRKIHDAK